MEVERPMRDSEEYPILGFTRSVEVATIIQRLVWNNYGIGVHYRPAEKGDKTVTGEDNLIEDQQAIILGLHLPSESNMTPKQYPELAHYIKGVQDGMIAQIVKDINFRIKTSTFTLSE